MNGQRLSHSGFGRRSRLGVIKALCGANCWLNAASYPPTTLNAAISTLHCQPVNKTQADDDDGEIQLERWRAT